MPRNGKSMWEKYIVSMCLCKCVHLWSILGVNVVNFVLPSVKCENVINTIIYKLRLDSIYIRKFSKYVLRS